MTIDRAQRSPWINLVPLAIALTCGVAPALGQDNYPARPVRIITTAGTGTSPDVVMRLVADQLSRLWGQQVVVENNSTGAGLVAAQNVSGAPPDGYTLLSASASAFTILPIRQERASTVIGTHLKPIALLGQLPMTFAVSPRLGVSTMKELIGLSQREPTRIFYAGNNTGTLPHMSAEILKARANASLTFVPYRGAADALTGVLSGQIDMIVENYASLKGTIKSGELKLLAFSSASRLPNFPDVPIISETVPDFLAVGWAALTAPIGVPDGIAEKINTDVRRIFQIPEVKAQMLGLGNYPADMSTADLARFIKQEQELWGPVVRKIIASTPSAQPSNTK